MYYIDEVQIQNVRNLKDQNINFEKGVNVIIGENGTGKTTLLKVIALSLCQKYMASALCVESKEIFKRAKNKKSISKIKFTPDKKWPEPLVCETNFDDIERIEKKFSSISSDRLSRQDANLELLYSVCGVFGAQRNTSIELLQEDVAAEIAPMEFFKPLFGAPQNFLNPGWAFHLFRGFYSKNPEVQTSFEKIQKKLISFLKLPAGSVFELTKERTNPKMKHSYGLSVVSKKGRVNFYDLSDGQKNIILMVFGIFYGVCLQTPRIINPLRANGVVLIDEIENHLHPSMEREILSFLRRCFPSLQFVVTTHSPNVVIGYEDSNVISLHKKGNNLVSSTSFKPVRENETISVPEILSSNRLFDVPLFSDSTEQKIHKYEKLKAKSPESRTEEEKNELNDLAKFFFKNELLQSVSLENYQRGFSDKDY